MLDMENTETAFDINEKLLCSIFGSIVWSINHIPATEWFKNKISVAGKDQKFFIQSIMDISHVEDAW